MNPTTVAILLRNPVAIILSLHSFPGMFNGGINDFGNLYLNQIGFAPIGLYLAWAIKLSHIAAALCLIFGMYLRAACGITIFILFMGIIFVHYQEGWYVVGGGRNGVEFNFLLIFVLLAIMFPEFPRLEKVNK